MKKIALIWTFMIWMIAVAAHANEPEWSMPLDTKVDWSQVTTAGTLLIASGKKIVHVDTEQGVPFWTINTSKKLAPFNVHELEGSGYLLIAEQYQNIPPKTRLSMYELLAGDLLWETENLLASNLAVIPDPERNQIIYIGAFPGSPKDKTNGTLIRAYDMGTGEMRYQTSYARYNGLPMHITDSAGTFSAARDLSGHPLPVIEGNRIYLSYGGLAAMDLDTGEILWDNQFKTADSSLKLTNARPVIEGNTIFAAGRGTVVAIDKDNGEFIWQTKLGSKVALPELQIEGDRILVRIGGLFSNGKKIVPKKPFGVASLDKQTGSKHWQWKKAKDSITNMQLLDDSQQILVADKKNLYRLDLTASGKAVVLEKRNLNFKRKMGGADTAIAAGKVASGLLSGGLMGGLEGGLRASKGNDRSDPPSSILMVNNDIVIRGNYHVLSYNPELNQDNWSIAFSPPGVSPMMLALSGATMAFTALGNAGYHSSMSTRNNKLDSSLRSADRLGQVMSRRYAAAQQAGNLGVFLTRAEKDSGHPLKLMGIDLTNGEEVGLVPITEKSPNFTVDPVGRRIYYFYKNQEIKAFEF